MDDSDDENVGQSGDLRLGAQQSEDDDDDDEELQPATVTKPQPQPSSSGGTLDRFLTKPSTVGRRRNSRRSKPEDGGALQDTGHAHRLGSAWGSEHHHPSKQPPTVRNLACCTRRATTATTRGATRNSAAQLKIQACCWRHARLCAGVRQPAHERGGLSRARRQTPKVHESARKITFVIKNEKVNKWWRWTSRSFCTRPCKGCAVQFTADELTIPNVPARMAMQRKLCKESPSWMASVAIIFKLPTRAGLTSL